jgi:hypothetical protein
MTFSYSKRWDDFYTFVIKVFVYPALLVLDMGIFLDRLLSKLFKTKQGNILEEVGYKTHPVNEKK